MRVIKRWLHGMEWYKFASFLYNHYLQYGKGKYGPDDFALFEEGAVVDPGVEITDPRRVMLKKFSVVHRGAFINSVGGLYLGNYSGIGFNCCIFTIDHKIFQLKSIPFDKSTYLKPVVIDDFVTMGANVCLMPGVHVGEGAVIGMGSVVTKDVPALAIVMGNPAEPVAYRDRALFDTLKEEGSFQSQVVEEYSHCMQLKYRKLYHDFVSSIGLDCYPQRHDNDT